MPSTGHGEARAPQESIEDLIFRRAEEVIGRKEEAFRWLGTPVRALNYATPISLMADSQGQKAVLAVLGRLEHGIF